MQQDLALKIYLKIIPMKFKLFYILIGLNSYLSLSQEILTTGKIVYDMNTFLGEAKNFNSVLYFSASQSEFIMTKNLIKNDSFKEEVIEKEDNSFQLIVNESVSDQGAIYIDKSLDILYETNELKPEERLLVWENIPIIEWLLLNEEKKIGALSCQKATTTFRGRHYTAWYTMEIPIPFGPWKFNGLPGMILEIYDDKKEVSFRTTSIEIPFVKILAPIAPEIEKITRAEFKNRVTKIAEQLESKILSMGNRDIKISAVTTSIQPGIEID